LFLNLMVRQVPGRSAKVTWEDLISLILIIQLVDQVSIRFRCSWRCCAAVSMTSWVERMDVTYKLMSIMWFRTVNVLKVLVLFGICIIVISTRKSLFHIDLSDRKNVLTFLCSF
jgi:hypothetical protein